MLLSMALVFTACEDDRDSNPTLVQPTGFTLNNPVNTLVDLAESKGIPFAWSQPDYGGWPAAVEYQLEVSPTNNWNYTIEEDEADESGMTVADYAILPSIYTSCTGIMSAEELAKALVAICGWDEFSVPEKQIVYVRATAKTAGTEKIPSNVVSFEVNPYYIELADAPIELWYLVGEGIGSADWDNGDHSVATGGLVPMYPIMGNDYDARTGQGEIQYAGFFYGGKGFKLIKVPGKWDDQWGMGDAGFVKNDGGSGNLTVEADVGGDVACSNSEGLVGIATLVETVLEADVDVGGKQIRCRVGWISTTFAFHDGDVVNTQEPLVGAVPMSDGDITCLASVSAQVDSIWLRGVSNFRQRQNISCNGREAVSAGVVGR